MDATESHALAIGSHLRDTVARRWLDDAVDLADAGIEWSPRPPVKVTHKYPASRAPAIKRTPMTQAESSRGWRERTKARMAADPAFRERMLHQDRLRGARKRARAKARRLMERTMGPGWIACTVAPKG